MNVKQRQLAAALAAVEQYLAEEAAAQGAAAPAVLSPLAEAGHWAQAGRMEAMSLRRMMQMRTLANFR